MIRAALANMIRLRPSQIDLSPRDVEQVSRRLAIRRVARSAHVNAIQNILNNHHPPAQANIHDTLHTLTAAISPQPVPAHVDVQDDLLVSQDPVPPSRMFWDRVLANAGTFAVFDVGMDGTVTHSPLDSKSDSDPEMQDATSIIEEYESAEEDGFDPLDEADEDSHDDENHCVSIDLDEGFPASRSVFSSSSNELVDDEDRSGRVEDGRESVALDPSNRPGRLRQSRKEDNNTFERRFSQQLDLDNSSLTSVEASVGPSQTIALVTDDISSTSNPTSEVASLRLSRTAEVRRQYGTAVLPRSPLSISQIAASPSPERSVEAQSSDSSDVYHHSTPPLLTPRRVRRYRPRTTSYSFVDSEANDAANQDQGTLYQTLLQGSVVDEPPSSPPEPIELPHRSFITEYSPHPAAQPGFSSPTLPSPFSMAPPPQLLVPGQTSLELSGYNASSPSTTVLSGPRSPGIDFQRMQDSYRTRSSVSHWPSSPPTRHATPQTPRHYTPSPSPPAPYTPYRSMRVYDDRLPASSQPQTPPLRQTRPFDPAFTAPVGSLREYRTAATRLMRARRGQMRSGSPVEWDDGEEPENVSAIIEAGRWEQRVRREMRRRRGSTGGEMDTEGSRLERTPEREIRLGG